MRKRRRLADKMTIMVCAVLVAVSAFFYAPMDVEAEEFLSFHDSLSLYDAEYLSSDEIIELGGSVPVSGVRGWYYRFVGGNFGSFDLADYFDLQDDILYQVDIDFTGNVKTNYDVYSAPNTFFIKNVNSSVVYSPLGYWQSTNNGLLQSKNSIFTIYFKGSDSFFDLEYESAFFSLSASSIGVDYSVNISFSNFSVVSSASSDDYQNGYNAGYSAGEQAGYGNGYSQGFTDGEASVDIDEIYSQGFNAGKESVDTQSYYDAGYQAGYQVAYQEGYDSGYDEGYQSAMDRIDGWGADTTDYPVLINELNTGSISRWAAVLSAVPSDCLINYWVNFDNNYNPNHTYKFSLQFFDFYMQRNSYQDYVYSTDTTISCNVGGILYPLRGDSSSFDVFYVPGNRISDTLEIVWTLHNACIDPTDEGGEVGFKFSDLNIKIYDLGPSGDTQNHIANQTDSLTNGFNDSHGNSVNNEFSSGLNDFETAEDSLFATATTGMKDFTFFDISSVPAMVTGMSFVGSIMSGWFTQAGGASGVGIVLSILFSIMLVAMVLGLYRWYQSKGGKD